MNSEFFFELLEGALRSDKEKMKTVCKEAAEDAHKKGHWKLYYRLAHCVAVIEKDMDEMEWVLSGEKKGI